MKFKDSESLAQSGYAQKKEDVDALTVSIEEKSAWSYYEEAQVIGEIVYISFVHLSIGMSYYQEGCNISRFRQYQKCSNQSLESLA